MQGGNDAQKELINEVDPIKTESFPYQLCIRYELINILAIKFEEHLKNRKWTLSELEMMFFFLLYNTLVTAAKPT